MSSIELRGVSKSYGAVRAVADISFSISAKSRLAIVGPSGSGKTTLLRLIAGFEQPDAGSISIDGEVVATTTSLVPAHERKIGYMPQDGALFPHLRIAQNIGFGLASSDAGRDARIRELCDMVSLSTELLSRWPHELSGGQQQRVALARALAQRPRIILLDEPFSALDAGLRVATRKAIAGLMKESGITAILVTHDQEEALSFADHLVVMQEGTLAQHGAPLDLYHRPNNEQTARFLGPAIVFEAELHDGFARCAFGRVPVVSMHERGRQAVMFRPEQLAILRSETVRNEADTIRGTVTAIDFGGPVCTLTVQPAAVPGWNGPVPELHIQCSSYHVPEEGSKVRIRVLSPGHILSPDVKAAEGRSATKQPAWTDTEEDQC